MLTWNTHAWYVTAILTVLLIGSLSVHWNAVKDLPGIVSFALGLSSLLLAVIAIVQTLKAVLRWRLLCLQSGTPLRR